MRTIELTLNGQRVRASVEPPETLHGLPPDRGRRPGCRRRGGGRHRGGTGGLTAVDAQPAPARGPAPAPAGEGAPQYRIVGTRAPRPDARDKVHGLLRYADDFALA